MWLWRYSVRWDAGWRLSIARNGYDYVPDQASSVAFFPLYPLAIGAFDRLLPGGYVLAALVVTRLTLAGATVYVYRLVKLAVDERPLHPARPVVCLDETSRQLLGEVRPPTAVAPGRLARRDPDYVRGGVVNLFLATEPLRGWRAVLVSEPRARLDVARRMQALVDVHDPAAERIVLVLDQLNTHTPAARYAAFPPAEAKRLADKLEVHYTPKHGSWLNMAELELRVLQRQCLRQRLPDRDAVERAVTTWATRRHVAVSSIRWQFTTAAARIKPRRLYPAFDA